MIIGVPKEIKTREYRVGMVPAGVRALVAPATRCSSRRAPAKARASRTPSTQRVGAQIVEQRGRGVEARRDDREGEGAAPARVRADSDGPDPLHLPPPRRRGAELTKELVKKKVAAVAYETIQLDDGSLPLLRPMSEVAGKMAIQVGAACLEKEHGGKGILLGGVPGVRRGRVVILGGGVVGTNAAKIAVGMGAEVTILDINLNQLAYLDDVFLGRVATLTRTPRTSTEPCARPTSSSAACSSPAARRPSSSPRRSSPRWSRAPSSSTSRWIRAAASRPAGPPRTTTRRTGPRRRPLLRGQHAGRRAADVHLRAHQHHPPLRAEDRRPRAWSRPSRRTRRWPRASTPTTATSPTRPSPRTWATPTCPSPTRSAPSVTAVAACGPAQPAARQRTLRALASPLPVAARNMSLACLVSAQVASVRAVRTACRAGCGIAVNVPRAYIDWQTMSIRLVIPGTWKGATCWTSGNRTARSRSSRSWRSRTWTRSTPRPCG